MSGGIAAPVAFLLFLKASNGNLHDSLSRALGFGLFSAMMFGLLALLSTSLRQSATPVSKRNATDRLLDGICTGACAGLGFGVVTIIQAGLEAAWLTTTLMSLASVLFGMSGELDLIRRGEIKTAETVAWSWKNIQQHMTEDMAKGATIGLSIALLVFCMLSLASGLFYGPEYGISYGVIYGVITGFIVGITSLLTTILNRGWESSMLSEDQLVHPNEGIRRSLRHSLFAGFFFGPIGGLTGGLVGGFTFGLIGRLPGWPLLAMGLCIVFTLVLTLQFALIRGGIACIEHYLLRWFLWRKTGIPLHSIQFLEFAAERILLRRMGGGYLFSHRLLQEYFASLEPETK